MGVPPLELVMGLEVYGTRSPGIGGRIRQVPEDFVVREVLSDGSVAPLGPGPGSPGGSGSFLLCSLVKKGLDTLKAVGILAKRLGIPEGLVDFLGLKDARALTAQFITVRGVRPKGLGELRPGELYVFPLKFRRKPLEPRELVANEFSIRIRGLRLDEAALAGRLDQLLSELGEVGGLPNFFGHQRFGTARPITHLVGREIVRGDVRRAVELFLAYPSPWEGPRAREARSYLSGTWDLKGFLELLPRPFYYERLMARHLLRKPSDYHGALRLLPLRLRRLFVQAYQAYLFNRFLSRRLREGMPLGRAGPGDWVLELDEHGLPTGRARKARREMALGPGQALGLPLPGFRQELSSGRQGEIEKEVLEEEGIRPEDFRVRSMPELASPGQLRPASVGLKLLSGPVLREDGLNPGCSALEMSFRLPRGSYATVFLRELMKPSDLLASGF